VSEQLKEITHFVHTIYKRLVVHTYSLSLSLSLPDLFNFLKILLWSNQHLIIVPCVMIVAAAEIPPSVSIKQSFRIGELKPNTSIAIHTYKTQKKKKPIHTCTYMSLKTYNCCERKRRKEKENINCLGAAICPSLTS
jgi:hypothetical protein